MLLLKRSALLAASLALVLGLAEIGLRLAPATVVGFEYVDGSFKRPTEFVRDDTRNERGFHDVEHGPKGPGTRRVVLLGDSYVEASSVPVEKTVGQRLSFHLDQRTESDAEPAYEVVSLGRSGWGQVQQLEALRSYGGSLEPDWVVTVFLSLNDVRDNWPPLERATRAQYRHLVRHRPGWTALSADEAPWLLFRWSMVNRLISHRLAYHFLHHGRAGIPFDYFVYAESYDSVWKRAWRRTERLIEKTRDEARGLGAEYAVVVASTPHGVLGDERGLAKLKEAYSGMHTREWDLDRPARRLRSFCEAKGIPFLSLKEVFRRERQRSGNRLHWKYDGHWNVAGNDLAGKAIAEFLLEEDES